TPQPAPKPTDTMVSVAGPKKADAPRDPAPQAGAPAMYSPGETPTTSSGRKTTPFPNVDFGSDRKITNTIRRVQVWLMENALAEAETRGDQFNATGFRADLEAARRGNLPPASAEAANEYLFGEQPPVVRPILKPMTPKRDAPAPE